MSCIRINKSVSPNAYIDTATHGRMHHIHIHKFKKWMDEGGFVMWIWQRVAQPTNGKTTPLVEPHLPDREENGGRLIGTKLQP